MNYHRHICCIFLGIPTQLHSLLVANQEGGWQFLAWGKRRDKAARFLLQKKITNRRCRVSLSWSVEVYKRKNKGIVSIKTYLNAVKLLFNELLRCLELPHETAILLYALQYFGVRSADE